MNPSNHINRIVLAASLFCAVKIQASYDPNIGRWASRDPVEEKDGPGIYLYTKNDGVNYVDAYGLWHWKKGKRTGEMISVVVPDMEGTAYHSL